jgi:transposase
MVNPIQGELIDVFPNRRKHNLEAYFMRIPIQERKQVRVVISDLWDPYRKLIKQVFPNAIHVADKYHFVRQLYWGLQAVRTRIMKQQNKQSIEYYLLKKYWRFYLKYSHNLSTKFFKSRRLGYHVTPLQIVDMAKAIHPDLKRAIQLKDEFYELLHTASFKNASQELNDLIEKLKSSNIPEYKYVARTYNNWFHEIIHSFWEEVNPDTGEIYSLTNGFIEGINNKIKVIKRNAFGYRNFWNFRTRIFASMNSNLPITS